MGDSNTNDYASKIVIPLSSSTSWEDIPDVLWEKIFCAAVHKYNQRCLEPISLVCKRFLSLSNNCLTSVSLSPSKSSQSLYSRFSFINTIKFSSAYPNLDATITQLADSNLCLQSLHLSMQTHFPKEAMRLLGLRMSKTLTSLSCVEFKNFGDADVDIVADCFPYLQKLDIEGNYGAGGQVTDEGILVISTKFKFLFSLKVTNHENLSHRAFEYLSSNALLLSELTAECGTKFPIGLDQFIPFSSLTSLKIESFTISETILGTLAEAKLKLRILYLLFPRCWNDIKGTTICQFFKSLASLDLLFLKRFPFTAGITASDFALSIPNLNELILHDSAFVQRASGCTLFQILKSSRVLKGMSICCSSLGPLQDWLNIPFRCQLEKLELYNCSDLNDQILECICRICPDLETLEIETSPNVTRKGIEAVKAACADLKLLYVSSCNLPSIDWEKKVMMKVCH